MFYNIPNEIISGIQIGVECGYDYGLKKVKKCITINQLFKALQIMHVNGYNNKIFLSFIIGFPWETEKEIFKTLNTVEKIVRLYKVRCSINWLIFLPSDLWKKKRIYNIDIDESIYDDPLWLKKESVFYKVHPNINKEIVKRVEQYIKELSSIGPYILHSDLNLI